MGESTRVIVLGQKRGFEITQKWFLSLERVEVVKAIYGFAALCQEFIPGWKFWRCRSACEDCPKSRQECITSVANRPLDDRPEIGCRAYGRTFIVVSANV